MKLTYIKGNDYSEGYYYGYLKAIREIEQAIDKILPEDLNCANRMITRISLREEVGLE